MRPYAVWLVARLLVIQFAVGIVIDFLIASFAPRLLLLDAEALDATLPTALWVALASVAFGAVATTLMSRKIKPTLRALDEGSDGVAPRDLLLMYALPARIAFTQVVIAFACSMGTVLPIFRPATNDLYTQVALVLLMLIMVSAGAVPLYVMMRASVARVIELAPSTVAHQAIALLRASQYEPRVRTRFLAAVTAPVGFVALAASLLVYAHTRAFDIQAREKAAHAVATATFDLVRGSTVGREQAIAAAERQGFRTEIAEGNLPFASVHSDDLETALTVPLEGAHAVVHFDTTRLNPITSVYILLAVIASTIAGILGSRIGALFSEDVALARHGVRATGVADVIRGTRMLREARFQSVSALMNSIDDLGGVFREFASAQQKAIDARGASERMRGLFLASMSHDLKAPLNSILGFTEIVSHSPLSAAQKESLAIVEQRGRELLVLIQTILDSARAEAGALEVHRDWSMVRDVVMSAVLDARDLAVVTEVQVDGEVDPDLPKIYIDPERIVQALTAVISSAVRFTDKGGVHVRATLPVDEPRLLVAVETSGRGLPVEERDKIFEAFKYADKARLHGSLGLGLALARYIIEIHGGTIEVDTSEHGGLAFRVWLPTTEMTASRLRRAIV